MLRKSLLCSIVVGVLPAVNILSISHASAGVTFLSLSVNAKGAASANNDRSGSIDVTQALSNSASTTDLSLLTSTGVSKSLSATANEGAAGKKATAAATEAVTATATSASDLFFQFGGFSTASTDRAVGNAGYAKGGDNGSSASYTFSTVGRIAATISWNTARTHKYADEYTVNVSDGPTSYSFSADANDTSKSWSQMLSTGTWTVTITEALGANAPDYVSLFGKNKSRSGSALGQFEVVLAVPELSTWMMLGLGFAGLGFLGVRAARQSVSIV